MFLEHNLLLSTKSTSFTSFYQFSGTCLVSRPVLLVYTVLAVSASLYPLQVATGLLYVSCRNLALKLIILVNVPSSVESCKLHPCTLTLGPN